MPFSSQTPRILRFGVFEVDLQEGELRKAGIRIKLQEQPFQVLTILLERRGEMVSRDELRQRLWPADTFVDFDHSLNSAIKKLREALGDQAENPRFIETLHRRGYRFIAPVENKECFSADVGIQRLKTESESGVARDNEPPGRKTFSRRAAIVVVVTAAIAAVFLWVSPSPTPHVLNYTQITHDGAEKISVLSVGSVAPPIVADGSRLYFTEQPGGSNGVIGQVSVTGSDTVLVSMPFSNAGVLGISPTGSDLLVYTWQANESEVPLWVVPVLGGSPRRIGKVTQDATWSADGRIVYSLGHDLYGAKSDGTESQKLVSVAGLPVWPRWSPDGDVLRFTQHDPSKDSTSLWEVSADGTHLHPLLANWRNHGAECCGNWTPDGSYYIFQSTRNGRSDLWAIREKPRWWRNASPAPVQLTAGPMSFSLPLPSRDGRKLFALGSHLRGELMRYDTKSGQFVAFLGGISATGLTFSRDGDRVAYVAYPEGTLWRSKADGGERLQLTFPPIEVVAPRWSPDGRQLAFMGKEPARGWRVYFVSSDGGNSPQEAAQGNENQASPDWSPDGHSVVFSGLPGEISGDARSTAVHLLDVRTGQTSTLPGSEGLYCPRWSPDGRYISATTADGRRLMLFDSTSRKWEGLGELPEGCPAWSRDGMFLYFQSFDVQNPALFRMRVSDRKRERLADINMRRVVAGWFWWNGLTPDNSPLVLRDESSEEIYALDWQFP